MLRTLSTRRLLVGLCLVAVVLAAIAPGAAGLPWAVLPDAAIVGLPAGRGGPAPGVLSCLPSPRHARAAAPRGPPLS
jgi:hypothetical protein